MNKFYQSVYSRYYKIVSRILSEAVEHKLTRNDVLAIIREHAFLETEFLIASKLIQEKGYNLLYKCDESSYKTVVKQKPQPHFTTLEKAWLVAVLNDPKSKLFIDLSLIQRLKKELSGIESLYTDQMMQTVDTYNQNFDYNDPHYQWVFKKVIYAIQNKLDLKLHYESKKGNRLSSTFRPIKLVYEHKADKFQLIAVGIKHYKHKNFYLNIEDIVEIDCVQPTSKLEIKQPVNVEAFVKFRIFNTRNAFERSFFHFSTYKTKTTYDEHTGVSTVTLFYNKCEENEIIIHLMSYGIALKVIDPPEFVDAFTKRLKKQRDLSAKFTD